jgi:hypothetical protein
VREKSNAERYLHHKRKENWVRARAAGGVATPETDEVLKGLHVALFVLPLFMLVMQMR